MPLIEPLKDTTEGYEEPVDSEVDGLAARGFFPQNGATPNEDAGVEKDGSGHLTFKDAITGTKTLAQLAASGTGVSEETHKTLLQLVHFLDEGPGEGFASGATKEVTGTVFPTVELWKRARAQDDDVDGRGADDDRVEGVRRGRDDGARDHHGHDRLFWNL